MKIFKLNLFVSILLIVAGFLIPPMGVIDGSVLTAVGELLMFGVLAQLPQLIEATKNGKSVKISKGDFSISASSEATASEATASQAKASETSSGLCPGPRPGPSSEQCPDFDSVESQAPIRPPNEDS